MSRQQLELIYKKVEFLEKKSKLTTDETKFLIDTTKELLQNLLQNYYKGVDFKVKHT